MYTTRALRAKRFDSPSLWLIKLCRIAKSLHWNDAKCLHRPLYNPWRHTCERLIGNCLRNDDQLITNIFISSRKWNTCIVFSRGVKVKTTRMTWNFKWRINSVKKYTLNFAVNKSTNVDRFSKSDQFSHVAISSQAIAEGLKSLSHYFPRRILGDFASYAT